MSTKNSRNASAFILSEPGFFEHVNSVLCDILAKCGYNTTRSSNASETLAMMENCDQNDQLLIVDPTLNDFDSSELKNRLPEKTASENLRVITILPIDDSYHRSLEDQLDASGSILLNYSREELAFALNQIIYYSKPNYIHRQPRVLTDIRADFSLGGKQSLMQGQIFNLSIGGMFLKLLEPLCAGETINLLFRVADDIQPIKVNAKIIHSHPYVMGGQNLTPPGMGLQFVDLDSQGKERIASYVQDRLPRLLRKNLALV